jgi:hypothetical protein
VTDVVFDVDFSAPSTAPEDAAFAAALEAVGGSTILPAFRQRHAERSDGRSLFVNRPIPAFADHAWLGLVNVLPEPDGVIRRYPFGARIDDSFIPSVGALLAGRHEEARPSFRIDFGIRSDTVPCVSAIDIAEGIETDEVARMLAAEGCDEGQGYLISRPVPAGVLEERFLGGQTGIAA